MSEDVVKAKLAAFFAAYPTKQYAKGHILLQAGEDPEGIIYLESGKVKQYDLTGRGDEMVLNVFKPDAFFPMSYAMNRTPNEYFFEADSAIELRTAPIAAVVSFVQENPDVLYDLLARVYRGTDGLLRRMAHLMASSARSRVIYELIIECYRFGDVQGEQGYKIALNESDISARAGLSRETVNRELGKLKNEGLITITNQHLQVPNLVKLNKVIQPDTA